MNFIRITGVEHPLYAAVWELYETAFPANERRDVQRQAMALQYPAYHMCAAVDGQQLLALAFYWCHGEEIFLEHLAVTQKRRGNGRGSEALRELLQLPGRLILEIERPVDALTRRRQRFYEHMGLTLSPFGYDAPSYQAGQPDCPLQLMSMGALTEETFAQHCAFLEQTVLNSTAGAGLPLKTWME